MIRESTFGILKKFMMFGITNIEVAKILESQIKDIMKETKDFEYSFELKIAICSMLIIFKDRTPK